MENPYYVLLLILGYFSVLIGVSFITAKGQSNASFFKADQKSPWYVVAFGMIGASLSGVTFISVPGWVETTQMSYMQMVLGYMLGYFIIATILLPLYYKLQLTSIYTYLEKRFGPKAYKTGASFFLLSRSIGASFRLYLVANVLQIVLFNALGVPFWLTVIITILLIWLYTFKAGLKTIVWTDTLQTLFMLLALGVSIYFIQKDLGLAFDNLFNYIKEHPKGKIFFFESIKSKYYFWNQFISGAFIAIVMTGLDQDMMQKNLSCKNLKHAQKNMFWFSIILVVVNFMFLFLGLLLLDYTQKHQLQVHGDDLFATIATQNTQPIVVAIFFILGLIAAAYSSADSALTSLTTSFSLDILEIDKKHPPKKQIAIRKKVHIGFSILLLLIIISFKYLLQEQSIIAKLFTFAGYTYGPLLGLYGFGLFSKQKVKDHWIPYIAILAPFLSYGLHIFLQRVYAIDLGFFILLVNGAITYLALILARGQEH